MNTGKLRLLHLRDQNDAAGEAMSRERDRFARIAGEEPTRAISSFNLFQTPEDIAADMAATLAGLIPAGGRVLEPSAGLGRLCRSARRHGLGPIVMVESSPECCAELYRQSEQTGYRLVQADFLACDAGRLGGLFDGVIMNPPFKQGRDIKHIRHAFAMLKPGGVLISLCFNGVRQNKHLRPIVDTWQELPAGSFKAEGTAAGVALLTWTK